MEIDVVIDELTNCIVCNKTKKQLDTEFILVDSISEKQATEMMNDGWRFDWSKAFGKNIEVYCLRIKNDIEIQGLIAIRSLPQNLTYEVVLVESAPHNVLEKKYKGVGGNLFAIACLKSFSAGYNGYVQFDVKTKLVEHYKKELNAQSISNQRMYIDTKAAKKLLSLYFKGEKT